MSTTIAVDVRGRARGFLDRSERARLVRRLARAMEAAGCEGAEVSLSLVDDDEIRALNKAWRGKDKPTDVLSFSQSEGEAIVTAAGEVLGDLVISVETAARQAEAAGRAIDQELLHLAVHGLAHLCGYDHATKAEERVMFGWEALLREQALARGGVRGVERPPLAPPARRVSARR